MRVGLLHPGRMGAALAAQIDGEVFWASEGRSDDTAGRSGAGGLIDIGSIADLAGSCEVIFSVCPPHAARSVAQSVSTHRFGGIYVDANAVAPATSREMSLGFEHFVDGGIVGPPPSDGGECRLYLSGSRAESIALLFERSRVEAIVVGSGPGPASALKAAYAGWTKGSAALLLAAAAYAQSEGVKEPLLEEWHRSIPDLPDRLEALTGRVGDKAWRFVGEMEEIGGAYLDAHLPAGFHRAAAEVYRRLSRLQDDARPHTSEWILALIAGGS